MRGADDRKSINSTIFSSLETAEKVNSRLEASATTLIKELRPLTSAKKESTHLFNWNANVHEFPWKRFNDYEKAHQGCPAMNINEGCKERYKSTMSKVTLIVRSPLAETIYLLSKSTTFTAARCATKTRRTLISRGETISQTAIDRSFELSTQQWECLFSVNALTDSPDRNSFVQLLLKLYDKIHCFTKLAQLFLWNDTNISSARMSKFT